MRPDSSVYASAKSEVKTFLETLAMEGVSFGTAVTAIAPGMILAPTQKAAKDWWMVRKTKSSFISLGRPGQPERVAGCAMFLALPAASYCTALTLTVDGRLSRMVALGA